MPASSILRLFLSILIAQVVLAGSAPLMAQRIKVDNDRVKLAIERGYKIIEAGVDNYPNHRKCFSCHHQALPLLSISLKCKPRIGFPGAGRVYEGTEEDRARMKSIQTLTVESFQSHRQALDQGKEIEGTVLTVAYGLWTMDMANCEANETTDWMVDYLLEHQAKDGAWYVETVRPPAASSRAMTTALAVYGIRAYGKPSDEDERVKKALQAAEEVLGFKDRTDTMEERNGIEWLSYMLIPAKDPKGLKTLRQLQNKDGGWGRAPGEPSDPYSTGQTLLMMAQDYYMFKVGVRNHKPYMSGVNYLLDTQQEDGSWHMETISKPVQNYFDNGDPHGKDQFISMFATSWAVSALVTYDRSIHEPLDSLRERERELEKVRRDRERKLGDGRAGGAGGGAKNPNK